MGDDRVIYFSDCADPLSVPQLKGALETIEQLRAELEAVKKERDHLADLMPSKHLLECEAAIARAKILILQDERDALKAIVEKAKCLINALTPEERLSEALDPECPALIAAIVGWEARDAD